MEQSAMDSVETNKAGFVLTAPKVLCSLLYPSAVIASLCGVSNG